MVKVEDESRASIQDGCGAGGEERHRVEIDGNVTVNGDIAGSVAGESELLAEKPSHESTRS
ncbi:hypothetical protein F2Q70_00007709 [Brassica cretica]|uniref:Uncharacterized protein n=1 Tax=Brassica cretica TaxID=69181 RepID=A0A8S9LWQ2_BRACR|nr:hypothetical protein F2Q70_00007709 [Brassica cretica]